MSLTNKLFSLLGFAEPVILNRFNGNNILPKKLLLLSTNNQISPDIKQAITQLDIKVTENVSDNAEKSIEALIIDATNYIDESSYQSLYLTVQKSLKFLSYNARILLISNATNTQQSSEHSAFSQALVGFTKSLAKEVGRKGSTANIVLLNKENNKTDNNTSVALAAPIKFFLSAKSAFVSGQALTISNKKQLITQTTPNIANKKVAVVTGAAQGIGSAIASKLADDGYFVIGIDIEPMKTQLVNAMRSLLGQAYSLDVSVKDAGEQLAALASKHQGFDLFVHNAGITRDKTLAKMPTHFWQQTIDINLLSVMRITQTLINTGSINSNGRIVCLSSMNGIAGQGGQTNYACSKAGIIGYVESMANELATQNITLNAVAPGFIETKMTEQMPFFTREMGRRMNALSQGGLPIDVAEAISFLGDESSYAISGQTLRVCGLNIIGA
ncbi:MAG: 3-oxoacyl-ACP reductase [Gammaproteobacteria bacterium]|nr:MAG: 3-oxoacyl-ACP reductase [Gammaproteobacteria bacterium]